MRRIPQAVYMTPNELDQRILELIVEAHHLEDSEERQAIPRGDHAASTVCRRANLG